ncbi:MAG TPA: phosphatase PAP2 family protein [Ignavibacteriaceae bacterium]|nr:phosphatase PAP2 family protein [Ignavibacteriaceae bacterium]
MKNIERENRKNSRFKKYNAITIIIFGLFIFFLCTNGFVAELTGGYQSLLYDWLGKTNKWSGTFGPQSFVDIMNELSALGSELFISVFSIVFGGYLFIRKKYRILYTYFYVVLGAGILTIFLKNYYGGEEWYNWFNIFQSGGKVFPSGHALMSVVFYFALARLLYRANPERKLNRYLMTIAFLLSLLIGISQIVKGSHSPNEIIAGWSLGLAWISGAWLLDRRIRKKIHHHHHIEEKKELTEA